MDFRCHLHKGDDDDIVADGVVFGLELYCAYEDVVFVYLVAVVVAFFA